MSAGVRGTCTAADTPRAVRWGVEDVFLLAGGRVWRLARRGRCAGATETRRDVGGASKETLATGLSFQRAVTASIDIVARVICAPRGSRRWCLSGFKGDSQAYTARRAAAREIRHAEIGYPVARRLEPVVHGCAIAITARTSCIDKALACYVPVVVRVEGRNQVGRSGRPERFLNRMVPWRHDRSIVLDCLRGDDLFLAFLLRPWRSPSCLVDTGRRHDGRARRRILALVHSSSFSFFLGL